MRSYRFQPSSHAVQARDTLLRTAYEMTSITEGRSALGVQDLAELV